MQILYIVKRLIKENKDLIIILAIITIVIIFMFTISFTLSFFKKQIDSSGEITLGELDYNILINYDTSNEIMPGDDVELSIKVENKVKNKPNLVPFYFRFEILNGSEEYDPSLITLLNADDYIYYGNFWYYKHKVLKNETANLLKSIHIDEELTQNESEYFDLQVLVEAVQSEHGAYKEVFEDAPEEWKRFVENN